MKIMHVVGARPNFMKIAPIMREMSRYPDRFEQILVHTGQHYDDRMSKVFFDDLDLPLPDINLSVGSGSHAVQTAEVMMRFEPVVLKYNPDWLLVPGDVNSTVACALVCSKLGIRVAHVEAGLRSRDRTMPEEINRLVTDQLSDLLLTPSRDADENLLKEGIPADKICFVGNVMIDTLVRVLPKTRERWPDLKAELRLPDEFALVTLHRPANVDDPEKLETLIAAVEHISRRIPVVFPVHPRTRPNIGGFESMRGNIIFTDPLRYLDFLTLQTKTRFVITDSGGIQEETTWLGVPCFTMRPNTERPVTVTHGTNRLVQSLDELVSLAEETLDRPARTEAPKLEYWDGCAAKRIVGHLDAGH
jgi:UDP-N-acetylglucosamine 2-epimerase (non-hydrolysing)